MINRRTAKEKVLMRIMICSIAFLVALNSYASKSRLAALQFADFWVDTQNIFLYPQYATPLGQHATFEYGPTGTLSTGTHAEGGFAKKMGDRTFGAYLGHHDTVLGTLYTAGAVGEQKNPLFLYCAKGDTGYGFNFSFSDIKSVGEKEMSIGGAFGSKFGDLEVGTHATAFAKSEKGAVNEKVIPSIQVSAHQPLGGYKAYGGANFARANVSGASDSKYSLKVGLQDQSIKLGQSGMFFYGSQVSYAKNGNTKGVNLPIYGGLESDLLSWAAIRAAISQSLINYQSAASNDIGANDTVVSLGATAKTGNFSLDGLLAAGTTGAINTTAFATSAAITYRF